MYDEIVSWENICQAYLDLYKKFVEKSKGHNYRGIDGQNLFDAEINIDNLLKTIQQDLKSDVNILPAKYSEITKKDGGKRGIYTLSIKDRIKCQAIARKIEPVLEAECSDYIYSFRKTKPSLF